MYVLPFDSALYLSISSGVIKMKLKSHSGNGMTNSGMPSLPGYGYGTVLLNGLLTTGAMYGRYTMSSLWVL